MTPFDTYAIDGCSGAAMPAEYASIDAEENHLYSDVQAKKGEADYAYAFNPGCQT